MVVKKSHLKHYIALAVVIITVLVIAGLVSSKAKPPVKPKEESSWTVGVETINPQSLSPELNILGRVESTRLTRLTSRVNGDVMATPNLSGTKVQTGQLILQLDPTEAQITVTQREADVMEFTALIAEEKNRHNADKESLDTEKNMVELAQKAVSRQKRLVKNNVTSEERLDTAEVSLEQQRLSLTNRTLSVQNHANRLAQLEARLTRAQAQLELARLDLQKTQLVAPFSGRVTNLHVAVGNRVKPGDPLIDLVADDSLEIRAQIPDRWVAALAATLETGSNTNAKADLFGQTHQLKLDRISASANGNTGGVDGYFKATDSAPLILDKAVELNVELPSLEAVYSLPVSAIYGDNIVYAVENDRLQAYEIERKGRYADENQRDRVIFNSAKLKTGAKVITTQLPKAVTGLKVRISN